MFRVLCVLALVLCLSANFASAQEPRFAVAAGPAFWFDASGRHCEVDGDVERCEVHGTKLFPGLRIRFDAEALPWLRLGAQVGMGTAPNGGLVTAPLTETSRSWFIPMGGHAYAHLDRGRVSLWLGPEVLYTLRIDEVERRMNGMLGSIRRHKRSGFMAGLAFGLDVRLWRHLSLGFEAAEAVAFSEAQRLPKPTPERKLSSVTRVGVLLRVAF